MGSPLRRLAPLLLMLLALSLLLFAAERAVALAERLAGLPPWLRWSVAGLLTLFVLALGWLGWRLWRPRARRTVQPVDRASLDNRINQLERLGGDTHPLTDELAELDRRRDQGTLYVAVFGEISSGKSSLIAALSGHAMAADVLGGTTQAIGHYAGQLDGRAVLYADVPGSDEVAGETRETLARDEALRAHVVLYVTAGDLGRRQGEALRWLANFGKPLLLVLNKADQFTAAEIEPLLGRLRQRSAGIAEQVLAVSAGGREHFERRLPDGRVEQVERARLPQIETLQGALARSARAGAATLEPAREQAVLASLDQRTASLETTAREAEAGRIVARYTRRAAVGALAAVVPGSDLVIQGALATALTRELAKLHDTRVGELEIDAFLKQARLTLRGSASVVLAIAGNALKAFPGLGTLGGGVLHAFAYALIFDSLGKALGKSFAEHRALDQQAANAALRDLLGDASRARLQRLLQVTRDAVQASARETDTP
ncbi:MAG TPA: GTPase [Rhodanobacteraceae bacterium]|nr:GTPase [Rhodanobacteraceae bacterium]